MNRSNRARCAIIALTIWTQACTMYRPAPTGAPLPMWRPVRVRSAEPFTLSQPNAASMLETVCRVTAVDGFVVRMVGDTLVLGHPHDVTVAVESGTGARRCPEGEDVTLILTPAMAVTEKQVDRGRTTALLVGLAAALVAFAAYAASNIDPGFPPSGGGTY